MDHGQPSTYFEWPWGSFRHDPVTGLAPRRTGKKLGYVNEDGVSNRRVFYDVNDQTEPGAADGMKVDLAGNIFATGPGGVWIFASDGTHLGTIQPDEVPANVGWGEDGRTLYMTARTSVYRIRLSTEGRIP